MRKRKVLQLTYTAFLRIIKRINKKLTLLYKSKFESITRNYRNDCFGNMCFQLTRELRKIINHKEPDIFIIAFVTRNLFELLLINNYLSLDEINIEAWVSSRVNDEIEALAGFLKIYQAGESNTFSERIIKLKKEAEKKGLTIRKPPNVSGFAELSSRREEYDQFFKFFSKYVHPSSWQINEKKEFIESKSFFTLFMTKTIEYAEANLHFLESIVID